MNQRIAEFETLWTATVLLPLMRPQLVRQIVEIELPDSLDMPRPELQRVTNAHEVLPPGLRVLWDHASAEEKGEIVKNYIYWCEVDIGV